MVSRSRPLKAKDDSKVSKKGRKASGQALSSLC
jgi:hypothetical protein